MAWKEDEKVEELEVSPARFTLDEINREIDESGARKNTGSNICAVVVGDDGTGKSGVCMDCRTEEETKEGYKVYAIDLDESASQIKAKYFRNDTNVVVLDPVVIDSATHKTDYIGTYNKTLAFCNALKKREEQGEKQAAVILDGLDVLLKDCEKVMRYQDLKIDETKRLNQMWDWQIRNNKFYAVVYMIKRMKCRRFFTTHYKEVKKMIGGNLVTTDITPIWQPQFPGKMAQKIFLSRIDENGHVLFKAKIDKSKGALHLEGKEYTVAEVTDKEAKWFGLKDFYSEVEEAFS